MSTKENNVPAVRDNPPPRTTGTQPPQHRNMNTMRHNTATPANPNSVIKR
ncbi:hypothetical protein ACFQ3P_13750 [Paraburkholderia sabiae]|uniref:Uncharacterized protein n=1 Tax=Paraburkholderia sabiae TaxID=273251 RepID=A0ABU9QDG1_9BURK|nr:hypothetical protein [Paraburkholderia sabiae]WJZ76163.1 hypothetical protein QEN71_10290 [Paraburkholderia sabiae]CAD6526033.1 hypothetical protein LMG24235_01911 [Paraburkholderia sabiae]